MPVDPLQRAQAWLRQDPDPETRAALQALFDAGDTAQIEQEFSGDIAFGTAGLRGELGLGPRRMNRVVVVRAAAGLGQWLLAQHPTPRVVIGFDARHQSEVFAHDTAEILHGLGVEALLLPRALPTPVLAFAVRYLAADAGVMVTASHNPASDNGYKVYLGDGTQIAEPVDAEIASHIAAVANIDKLTRSTGFTVLGEDIAAAYVDAVAEAFEPTSQNLTIAYTPMHGVGASTFLAAARRCGFSDIHTVSSQAEPDPNFPTLPFPNPEEPGALDELLALAQQVHADLAIAHDPDADRLGVCVRDGEQMRQLTGDELGALLAHILLKSGRTGTYANSIVSGTLLGKLAHAHGQAFTQTLTGFKWIGKVDGLAFGYEEALGYCVRPDLTGDKDGISAALLLLNAANDMRRRARTLLDELDDLAREFGVHATRQVSIRANDMSDVRAVLAGVQENPPTELGGQQVTHIVDLSQPLHEQRPTDGMKVLLDGGCWVVFRPSGTEPKLKCYIEVVAPVRSSLVEAKRHAAEALDAIATDLATVLSRAQSQ